MYFYILAVLLKRKAGRRKPDGTAYQPKIECSAPEKPLQQMTGVGQVNMIFLTFKSSLFFFPFLLVGCSSAAKAVREEGRMGEETTSNLEERVDGLMVLLFAGFYHFRTVIFP